jgi:hypothetical protein
MNKVRFNILLQKMKEKIIHNKQKLKFLAINNNYKETIQVQI